MVQKGLLHFVSAYDNVDLFFDVLARNHQLLGTGAFIDEGEPSTYDS